MKSFLFALIGLVFFMVQHIAAQTSQGPKNGAVIVFAEASHDFGDLVQGQKVEYVFKYKNTGTEPLIVSEVITTCGCTATQWSKLPLAPTKESEIKATFNSEGKMGRQNKVITILSNATNNAATVTIVCNVLPATTSSPVIK